MSKYFYLDGVKKCGPFTKDELKGQQLSRGTKVWCYGMDSWTNLSDVPELIELTTSIPPDIKQNYIIVKENDVTAVTSRVKQNRISSMKALPNNGKLLIGIIVVLFISFLVYSSIRNQSDVNLYKEIVKNSYDSDENFEMYVEKFYRDLQYFGIYPKKPKTTIIKLSKLDQLDNTTHIHGLSFGGNDDDKIEIYINPSTWKSFNKPMRYFLMYHELAHDILNVDDLEATSNNEGRLMYPEISSFEKKNMDDFIESTHALFEQYATE